MFAAQNDYGEGVLFLVKSGADTDARDQVFGMISLQCMCLIILLAFAFNFWTNESGIQINLDLAIVFLGLLAIVFLCLQLGHVSSKSFGDTRSIRILSSN